ncbi:hypothetical protein kpv71_13 [Klebsiella phage KpV71]|jgi:hypothetical protein|uniref:Uncharacterized protein n=1 Tax=Klebsiella phage KpV71 TaxID=1796998 RepID=A0A142F0Y5_BPK71|nr:hypothetical protein BJD76_gp13 [Klebsiella phage KpV71]AMQ66442.1 hypothetical protein kpv71_13 [Klebsiella phage KpV71]
MQKFKVGDKVVRKEGMGKDKFFRDSIGGSIYYVVTSVSNGGYWLQLDGWCSNRSTHPWYVPNFELYQEQENELPPVPDGVTYMNSKRAPGNDQRLVLERYSYTDENLLYIGIVSKKKSTRAELEIGINIDPDSALQLAHDLRRMAMKIKREQK